MTAAEIVTARPITQVWIALGGDGPKHGRARAFWRDGDNHQAVSLNDAKGCWFDHRDNVGGGVLDLVQRVHGCDRGAALRFVADLAGVRMDDTPLSEPDRVRWAAERREVDLYLPTARYWRRAAVCLGETTLAELKDQLVSPKSAADDLKAALAGEISPQHSEIGEWTAQLALWNRLDGAPLVAEYRWWAEHHPQVTAAMVRAAKIRERAEVRALAACFSTQKEVAV